MGEEAGHELRCQPDSRRGSRLSARQPGGCARGGGAGGCTQPPPWLAHCRAPLSERPPLSSCLWLSPRAGFLGAPIPGDPLGTSAAFLPPLPRALWPEGSTLPQGKVGCCLQWKEVPQLLEATLCPGALELRMVQCMSVCTCVCACMCVHMFLSGGGSYPSGGGLVHIQTRVPLVGF